MREIKEKRGEREAKLVQIDKLRKIQQGGGVDEGVSTRGSLISEFVHSSSWPHYSPVPFFILFPQLQIDYNITQYIDKDDNVTQETESNTL